ncbi:cupin domain-containing protein [Streptomyces sp. NPDC048248]|uniref:cupin domain-containing protein n=1 Tax=Streptomyces sp. NPDC048248 TaxID=3365523 RepID=UPI003721170E
MSFDHERAPRAIYVPPGAGLSRWVFGDRYTIKADVHSTNGALGLMEGIVPPGGGPPPHIHHKEDEAFYLLEGELELVNGDRQLTAEAGSFVFVPHGTVHGFKNVSDQPCKMLIMFLPGGVEQFFAEVGTPADEDTPPPPPSQYENDVENAMRIVSKYGATYV